MITRALLPVCFFAFVAAAQDQPPEEVKQYMLSAQQKAQAGDFKGAIEDVGKALEILPDNKGLWMMSGRLKMRVRASERLAVSLALT